MTIPELEIRSFHADDRAVCTKVLGGLSYWFGIAESNEKYLRELGELDAFVAVGDGRVLGFASLRFHDPASAELEVLAVEPSLHRQGIGRRLVDHLEAWLRRRGGVRLFHVKTLGASDPDEKYARTRRFYLALGFVPLFESAELWGPENPALILVKPL